MAAPKAPSELGQSWPELITAAVLLFVPPPQDGVAFGTLYQVAGIYRLTYIVHLHVPLYGSTIFFPFARENFLPSGSSQPPGSFATALPYTCHHFRLLAGSSFLYALFFGRFYNVEPNCSRLPGEPWSLRDPREGN